jgi:WD40 repeat protein
VPALDAPATAVAFSPAGRLLAVTGVGGRVTLWDARTLRREAALPRLRGAVQALAFSPDGKLLAYAEVDVPDPRTLIWDVRSRRLTAPQIVGDCPDAECSVSSLAFSPNSRMIAEANQMAGTEVSDVRTGRLITALAKDGESRSVAFSPDGKLLVVGQFDGKGFTFSTTTWKRLPQMLDEHAKRINSIGFTPDSRTLATSSADGTVQLWDAATDQKIGGPFTFETGTWVATTFSPDGRYLYAISTTGDGIRFDMAPAAWSRHACQLAGRELTVREWREAVPNRPYRRLCGATPMP